MTSPGPVAFSIFGIDIMWYGILIGIGFLAAILLCCRRAPRHDLTPDHVINLALFLIPISVIGARAYYVIFSWDMYRGNLSEIFDIRGGGLAIHGGLIAGVLTALIFTRVQKISFLNLLDLIFPTVAFAQAIGRWGNFFNSEAHGGPTDLPWGILVDGQTVHPTFLYESIWCFILFIILIKIDNNRKFTGQTTCLYGMLYSLERFFVEGLRTDSLMIGPLRQAQVISVCIFAVCALLYVVLSRRSQTKA